MLYFSGTIWCVASLFSTILSGHFYLSKVTFTFQILTSQRHMLFCTVIVVRIISKTHGLKKSVKLPSSFDTAEQFRWTEKLPYQLNTELSFCWYNQLLVISEKMAPSGIYVQYLAHKLIITVESCKGKAVAIQFLKHHVPQTKLTSISSTTRQFLEVLFYVTCQEHGLRLWSI